MKGAANPTSGQARSPPGHAFVSLLLRLFITRELVTLMSLPMAMYVDALLLDLKPSDWHSVAVSLALTYGTSGLILSLLVMGWLLHRALRVVPGEAQGRRLGRLLSLPWKLHLLGNLLMWALGGLILNTSLWLLLDRSPWIIPLGVAVATGVGLLSGALLFVLYERLLMPFTLEEFKRCPHLRPSSTSLLRPRQSWFLPYALASLLFGTLIFTGTVVGVKFNQQRAQVEQYLNDRGEFALVEYLEESNLDLLRGLLLPVGSTSALLLFGSTLTAWWMGRRQRDGAAAIYQSLKGLTQGTLRPPPWVSTDEMGDLAAGVWLLLDQLQALPRELQDAARRLSAASASLGAASSVQQQTLERQSAAIQETVTTAEEIRQISIQAQSRVQSVRSVSTRTSELGQQGEAALQQSIQWLGDINSSTEHIRRHVGQLGAQARQIDRIVQTVKDLASRSNLLAINAAIQAVYAGEQGRGFTVVAREFRSLADRSVQATQQVSTIVEQLGSSINETVTLVDKGTHGVAEALTRLEATSAPLTELAQLAQNNATAMNALATAVSQQHQGINQLFEAIHELLSLTDMTLEQLHTTRQAASTCDEVSETVNKIASRYA